jgi:hypothetical protein
MKQKIVYILVLLLLISSFSLFWQSDEIKNIQIRNQLENSKSVICTDDSSNLLEQMNENTFISLDAGFDIITYAGLSTEFKAQASCPELDAIEYYWDFNNDEIFEMSTLEYYNQPSEVTYIFNETGNFTAKVEAQDPAGIISSTIDLIKVCVKTGMGSQDYVDELESELLIGPPDQPSPPDGVIDKYAIMINGGEESRFWVDVEFTYDMLINDYEYSPDNIYLLNYNGLNPDGENPNDMIDFEATHYNVHMVFNDLAGKVDGDDILLAWVTDHGIGMFGPGHELYGYLRNNVVVSVDPDDEHDYLESEFKLRSFYIGGDYKGDMGMGIWKVYNKYLPDGLKYNREKYVSCFTNIYFEELGGIASDSDKLIEYFIDYLEGDFDQDGFLETDQGEVFDYDGDNIPPYDPLTGLFDEDDWGDIHHYEDNWGYCSSRVPGGVYMIFDEGFDNHLDIDVDTTYFENGILIVDGTDMDNQGLFDGLDVNSDGDKDDWVSIDEAICLYASPVLQDDELAEWLKDIEAGRIITVLEPCHSGGFIWDIRGPKIIACSATVDDDYSWENVFIRGITSAFHWEDEYGNPVDADTNEDGYISVAEAFNYAADNDYFSEIPQYDDNGDGISHTDPIPNEDDGELGEKTYLWGYEKSENPPNKPVKPSGELNGQINIEYTYSSSTIDLDGDQVFYLWDWGDGFFSDWLGPYDSGETCEAKHTWSKKGTYSIRAKAMDIFGDESIWSDPLSVTMPVNQFIGYATIGFFSKNIQNQISGTNFEISANGTADCIIAYIQANLGTSPRTKCMIYSVNDLMLVGMTEEKTVNTGGNGVWITYNFSDPKPHLITNTVYTLVCWSNESCNLLYDNASNNSFGRYKNQIYGRGNPPERIIWDSYESRLYSIYCGYSTVPEVKSVSSSPNPIGFGYNTTITADIELYGVPIDIINVSIDYPNSTARNFSMTQIDNDTFQYVFNDNWVVGQYNYSIWVIDKFGANCSSENHSFNVSAQATINIAALKNSYSSTQYINITDPPNPPENYTLVDRGLTWNTYYNASSGENILETYQGPVNYQQDNGTWTPINNTFYQLASNHPAYVYGYRNGNDHGLYGVYFKSNAQNDWPIAFTYNRSDDPTTHVIRSKLVGVGYVDPQSNWAYQYLQNVQNSQGQNNGYSITYPGVFTGTDVTWSYGSTGLKEDITLSNTTKTVLQNHPPSLYGLNDTSSYLVFITKLDYQNLDLYNDSGLLDGNVTISDAGVDFRDVLGQFKCALPLGDAYELNNETARQKLTYRIIHLNGNTYLLSGLKVSDLNAMTFPVVVDPTLTVYSSSNDGYIYTNNANYNTVRNASSGTVASSGNTLYLGQRKFGSTYFIYRGFVLFNTTALPSNAYIDNATVSLYKNSDYSTTDFLLTVQNGQPTYPHSPLQSTDYNRNYYSVNGGSFNTSGFGSGYNTINLNTNGISWLNKTGWTKFCLRSNRDINGNTPTGNEFIIVYANEQGSGYQPKLVINYRNQSKIKNTGLTDIKGYLLIQVQFYETIKGAASRWVVDNDTINETSPRSITNGNQLALDTIFNGHVRASDLTHGTGTYRVYAAFRDPEGNILRTDDGSELKAWWQFNKT